MRWVLVPLAASLAFLTSCGALVTLDPSAAEHHAVPLVSDPGKAVRGVDGMVFYKNSMHDEGIRFPGGIYTLEAEDEGYLYSALPRHWNSDVSLREGG